MGLTQYQTQGALEHAHICKGLSNMYILPCFGDLRLHCLLVSCICLFVRDTEEELKSKIEDLRFSDFRQSCGGLSVAFLRNILVEIILESFVIGY